MFKQNKKREIEKIEKDDEIKEMKRQIKGQFKKIFSKPLIEGLRVNKKEIEKEKKRLGLPLNRIGFTAVSVIAQMFWCEKKAYFDAQNETKFYEAYLSDKKVYGPDLTEEEINRILDPNYVNNIIIGDGHKIIFLGKKVKLTREDRDMFAKMTIKDFDLGGKTDIGKWFRDFIKRNNIKSPVLEINEEDIEDLMIKNSNKDSTVKNQYLKNPYLDFIYVYNTQDDLKRGIYHQKMYSERYPTMRYHFRWKDYIIETIPDGITNEFCYEFKSTKKKDYIPNVKKVAAAQAHLYSYFFKRPKVRIQIYAMDVYKKFTFDEKADYKFAEEILEKFDKLISGSLKIENVPFWKCYNCEYKDKCEISKIKKKYKL
jgi:hypothetical protein